jgi:hypothetical protein
MVREHGGRSVATNPAMPAKSPAIVVVLLPGAGIIMLPLKSNLGHIFAVESLFLLWPPERGRRHDVP